MRKSFLNCMVIFISCSLLVTSAFAREAEIIAYTPQGKPLNLYSKYYALVMGVSDYRSEGVPYLPNAAKDARDVASTLKEMGFNVSLLLNPTSRQMKKAFNDLVKGPASDSNAAVFIFFSGHGVTETLVNGRKLGYILPADAPIIDKDYAGFVDKAISMEEIGIYALRMRAKHVLMVFDSCFSGAIFESVRAMPVPISEITSKPVREFITSGRENEEVPDRSVFKICLLQALKDGYADSDGDGYITGSELGAYLQYKVPRYNRGQHPQFGKINDPNLDKGEFVFLFRPSHAEEEATGSIKVESEPSKGDIYLDGVYVGKTPYTVSKVSAGKHAVVIRHKGFYNWKKKVRVGAKEKVLLFASLRSMEEIAKPSPLPSANKHNKPTLKPIKRESSQLMGATAERVKKERRPSSQGVIPRPKSKRESNKVVETVSTQTKLVQKAEPEKEKKPSFEGSLAGKHEVLKGENVWKDPYMGMEFVWVPGGCFNYGSERKVCVSGFWMSKYEVTFEQFDRFFNEVVEPQLEDTCLFCQTGNCVKSCEYEVGAIHTDEGWGRGRRPAINVSWYDAVAFSNWLSRKTGRVFRLPTEAEWEYACSGGGIAHYGTQGGRLSFSLARYDHKNRSRGTVVGDGKLLSTAVVGSFPPNSLGLYDMSGNVWEWCLDTFKKERSWSEGKKNPAYTDSGLTSTSRKGYTKDFSKKSRTPKVIKGGGWDSDSTQLTCTNRISMSPKTRHNDLGFRLVMVPLR